MTAKGVVFRRGKKVNLSWIVHTGLFADWVRSGRSIRRFGHIRLGVDPAVGVNTSQVQWSGSSNLVLWVTLVQLHPPGADVQWLAEIIIIQVRICSVLRFRCFRKGKKGAEIIPS